MNSKIIKQEKNPFLEREEITLEIKNKTTPTSDEVKSTIGKDLALTIVKKINTNFGSQTFTIEALIYDNTEAKNKIETIPQKVRKKMEANEKTVAKAEPKTEEPKSKEPTETPANAQQPTTNDQSETKPEEKQNE